MVVLLRKRSGRVAAVGTAAFPVGTEVEVQMSDDGFKGAWYEATVTEVHPQGRRFDVVYTSLVADDEPLRPLQESVGYSNIRPRAPRQSAGARYKVHQIVDVYYNDGWWLGVVSAAHGGDPPTRYTVSFPSAREEADFGPSEMRLRLNWRHEQWSPAGGGNQAGALFGMGKPVEVCYAEQKYGTAWYAGTVKKVIEKTIFLVEYKKFKEDGSPSMTTEILDAQYLRPVPPPMPKGKVFGLLDEVEVCLCGGWVTGVVMKVVDGLKYVVELTNGKEEEIEVDHNEIRVYRYWNGRWNCSYKRRGPPSVNCKTPDMLISTPPSSMGKMGEEPSSDDFFERRGGTSLDDGAPDLLIKVSPSSQSEANQTNKMNLETKMGEGPSSDDSFERRGGTSLDDGAPDLLIQVSPSSQSGDKMNLETKMGEGPSNDDSFEHRGGSSSDGRSHDHLIMTPLSSSDKNEQTNDLSLKHKMEEGPNRDDSSEDHEQPLLDGKTHDLCISDCPLSLGDTKRMNKMRPGSIDLPKRRGRLSHAGKTSDMLISASPLTSSGATRQTNKTRSKRKVEEGWTSEGVEPLQPSKKLQKGDSGRTSEGVEPLQPSQKLQKGDSGRTSEGVEPLQPSQKLQKGDSTDKVYVGICPQTPVSGVEVPAAMQDFQSSSAPIQSSEKKLPFVKSSVLWKTIETMEIFQSMPQEPSFTQLEQYSSTEIREGMAVGLMVTFANLVDSIKKLSILSAQASFNEKLKALVPLEENGFDVQRIRSRIVDLLEIQNDQRQFSSKGASLEEKIWERESEMGQLKALKSKLDNTILELEQKLARLRAESESVALQMMNGESEIAKLKTDAQETKEAFLRAEQRFNSVLDSPW